MNKIIKCFHSSLDFPIPILTWQQLRFVQPGINPAFIVRLWDGEESQIELTHDGFILRSVTEAPP